MRAMEKVLDEQFFTLLEQFEYTCVKLLPDGLNDGWLDGPDEGWELGADDTERG